MVFAPFCYTDAAVNPLTNPALDPFGEIPEFKFCAMKAEKVGAAGLGGVVGAPAIVLSSCCP
jgi:hypothetical protein